MAINFNGSAFRQTRRAPRIAHSFLCERLNSIYNIPDGDHFSQRSASHRTPLHSAVKGEGAGGARGAAVAEGVCVRQGGARWRLANGSARRGRGGAGRRSRAPPPPRASIAETGRARTRRTLACRSVRGTYVLTVVSRCLAHVYVLFCDQHQIIAIKVLGVKLEMKTRPVIPPRPSNPITVESGARDKSSRPPLSSTPIRGRGAPQRCHRLNADINDPNVSALNTPRRLLREPHSLYERASSRQSNALHVAGI
ncbi:unnamed protein product [Chrysodeixis includens]|uniref:Uncharacterized protein n=1 Tax=Chrysodeixis includens TaxID=689277 RepID=A0A9N8KYF1_CHRIL|nr:unnamed protein product [Chrysodeixis includens]